MGFPLLFLQKTAGKDFLGKPTPGPPEEG